MRTATQAAPMLPGLETVPVVAVSATEQRFERSMRRFVAGLANEDGRWWERYEELLVAARYYRAEWRRAGWGPIPKEPPAAPERPTGDLWRDGQRIVAEQRRGWLGYLLWLARLERYWWRQEEIGHGATFDLSVQEDRMAWALARLDGGG